MYENIFAISDNSYVCNRKGKYGIYNTELKRMTVPVIYEDIASITEDSVNLIKDGEVYCVFR